MKDLLAHCFVFFLLVFTILKCNNGSCWTLNKRLVRRPHPPYTAVLVVEVDNKPKWSPSHWLRRDEGILKGCLPTRRNYSSQLERCEVLNVELVILIKKKRNRITDIKKKSYTGQFRPEL